MADAALMFIIGVLLVGAWVGHAYWLTGLLNYLYAKPIPKPVLKVVRLLTGLLILAFPFGICTAIRFDFLAVDFEPINGNWGRFLLGYSAFCGAVGLLWFPAVTLYRAIHRPPSCVLSERTETLDFGTELGSAALGDGKHRWAARLPMNCLYRVDFTELTLAVPGLPAAWDGLTVLLLSDLHFHGTPSRVWFDRVFDRIAAWPTPDVVALAGDYLDTDRHHHWIGELGGRLKWNELGVAILGNHDKEHDPERVRKELSQANYRVVSNRWDEAKIRGERCVLIGHEGPWIGPPPELSGMPADPFRLCLSHTPDHYYWGQRHGINLMLCGHVHGGQIRVPVIGSIFVPSVYGRRFDMGVFAAERMVMVVGRGLSGKEPLRFRCNPQVLRLTLRPAA